MKESRLNELIEKLEYAKDAVKWLLDHSDGTVDFHGLIYRAGVVEQLRMLIE